MKTREVRLHVTDHAVLRYLEQKFGLDVPAVRRHLGGMTLSAAQLGAIAVKTDGVRLHLEDAAEDKGRTLVEVVNCDRPHQPRERGAPEMRDD